MLGDSMGMSFVCHDYKVLIGIVLMCHSNSMRDMNCSITRTVPSCRSEIVLGLRALVAYHAYEDSYIVVRRQLFIWSPPEAAEVERDEGATGIAADVPSLGVIALGPFECNVLDSKT